MLKKTMSPTLQITVRHVKGKARTSSTFDVSDHRIKLTWFQNETKLAFALISKSSFFVPIAKLQVPEVGTVVGTVLK